MGEKTRISAIRLAAIITAIFIILMLSMTSLNLSLPTESYSPFHGFAAVQTITMTIIGMMSFVALILIEDRGASFDAKSIMFVFAVVMLSFLIQYTADPRQLQQFSLAFALLFFLPGSIPIIEAPYFTTIYFLPLFVYGSILGLLLSFLLSAGDQGNERPRVSTLADFAFRSLFVVLIGPAILTLPIGFAISLLRATPLPFFPFYGEGTAGSMLVVSVILGMYLSARLVSNFDTINLKEISKTPPSKIASVLIEVIAVYSCTTAAFSLMGGLLTDGTPPPLLLPLDYVILTLLATIPLSLLIARERLFPVRKQPQV
ncbi:MAG: hypothetical protein ACW98J_05800 [Candidatus Thorarchaeota archaeon]|jgi:hypothetical protein